MTTFAASCGECIHKGFKEKPFDPNYRKRERFATRPSLEELFAGVSEKAPHNGRVYQRAVGLHINMSAKRFQDDEILRMKV
jgi:hypothetical protein